jgi:hypothetical protein
MIGNAIYLAIWNLIYAHSIIAYVLRRRTEPGMSGTGTNLIAIGSRMYGCVNNVEGKSSIRHKLSRHTCNKDMAIFVALAKFL